MGNFEAKLESFNNYMFESGGYKRVIEGLQNTVNIAVLGMLIGMVIGILIATVRVIPKYKTMPKILNGICSVYVALFRGTPIVVQLLVFYYVLFSPSLLNITFMKDPVNVSILVFGLNSGAYISEIMRGGILSVDKGQMEGGRAMGLSFGATMIKIVIPQAIKNIIPTMGNEFIALIKETSVVSFVGAVDLYRAFNDAGSNTYEFMVPYLAMALIYIVMVLIISLFIKLIERRLRKGDKSL